MTKKHHKFKEFAKFLTNPKVHTKVSKGFRTVVEGAERINYGMEDTIGLPHKRPVNPLPNMAEGVMHTLPVKHHHKNLGRIVIRHPYYKFP